MQACVCSQTRQPSVPSVATDVRRVPQLGSGNPPTRRRNALRLPVGAYKLSLVPDAGPGNAESRAEAGWQLAYLAPARGAAAPTPVSPWAQGSCGSAAHVERHV